MPLTKRQDQMLNQIVTLVEKFCVEAAKQPAKGGRVRRTAAEAEKMRKDILAARAKGVSAAKLAEKFGVSSAYIYMIRN